MPSVAPLTDIAFYHLDAEKSLRLYYSSSNPNYLTTFVDKTQAQVSSELKVLVKETEIRSILIIIARLEAAFRLDMKYRVHAKHPDDLSIALRALHKKKSNKAGLEQDIFPIWKEHLDEDGKKVLSGLKTMLKYRHWIAHGRYWQFSANHNYVDTYLLADTVLNKFGLMS